MEDLTGISIRIDHGQFHDLDHQDSIEAVRCPSPGHDLHRDDEVVEEIVQDGMVGGEEEEVRVIVAIVAMMIEVGVEAVDVEEGEGVNSEIDHFEVLIYSDGVWYEVRKIGKDFVYRCQ